VHAGTTLAATALATAERTGASGQDVAGAFPRLWAAGRIGEAIHACFPGRGFHGCLVAIFGGAVASGADAAARRGRLAQAIALSGDVDRRAGGSGKHQRFAANIMPGWPQ